MPTKPAAKKSVKKAKPAAEEHPLAHPPKENGQRRTEFGSEHHAMRTIRWAADLRIVPESVYIDASRAEQKSELIEALEKVKAGCLVQDYVQQAKRVEEVIAKLSRFS